MKWNPFKRVRRRKFDVLTKYAGHTFYAIGDVSHVVAARYLAFIRLIEVHQLGVSEIDLHAFFDLINDAVDRREYHKIPQYTGVLSAYVDMYTSNNRIFEIANCFVLIDDEPADTFSDEHTMLKKRLFDDSETVRFFFIDYAVKLLRNTGHLSNDTNVADYLKSDAAQLAENQFLQLITNNTSAKSKQT